MILMLSFWTIYQILQRSIELIHKITVVTPAFVNIDLKCEIETNKVFALHKAAKRR